VSVKKWDHFANELLFVDRRSILQLQKNDKFDLQPIIPNSLLHLKCKQWRMKENPGIRKNNRERQ
jgi:hypothetical protein